LGQYPSKHKSAPHPLQTSQTPQGPCPQQIHPLSTKRNQSNKHNQKRFQQTIIYIGQSKKRNFS